MTSAILADQNLGSPRDFASDRVRVAARHARCSVSIAGNNCVLFTANDAYMRGYRIIVPADTVVSNTRADNRSGLQQMRTILKAHTPEAARLQLGRLRRARDLGAG